MGGQRRGEKRRRTDKEKEQNTERERCASAHRAIAGAGGRRQKAHTTGSANWTQVALKLQVDVCACVLCAMSIDRTDSAWSMRYSIPNSRQRRVYMACVEVREWSPRQRNAVHIVLCAFGMRPNNAMGASSAPSLWSQRREAHSLLLACCMLPTRFVSTARRTLHTHTSGAHLALLAHYRAAPGMRPPLARHCARRVSATRAAGSHL